MDALPYVPTIGLEIHAELKTRTKMFCDSANDPDETRPNVNVCPVCLAHPGTLPVINREAVKHVLRVGAAIGGTLADYTEFDRKSYFYPDIPKGYQISQYEYPLVTGGELAGVAVTRVHLEEDTARSSHEQGVSLVDFNRAGVPLMELVTEPVIHGAEAAGRFARELQLLLRTLGAGEANLEKGEMRVEANISVSAEPRKLGTKVEVKNLNSFRSVERAIAFEIDRHIALLREGKPVTQETRGWDEEGQRTFSQRLKEGSADYRYFPEPDLPKLMLSEDPECAPEAIRASLPELPDARRGRYRERYTLKESLAEQIVKDPIFSVFFDAVAAALAEDQKAVQLAANYLTVDLAGIQAREGWAALPIDPRAFAKLIRLAQAGTLSSRGAKDTLELLVAQGGDPEELASAHELIQIQDDGALREIIAEVVNRETKAAEEYRSGKEAALQYLVGMSMWESKGAGNPSRIRELLIEELGR